MDNHNENNEKLYELLKNDSTFIRVLRGPIPEVDVEQAKSRLFERLFAEKYDAKSYD